MFTERLFIHSLKGKIVFNSPIHSGIAEIGIQICRFASLVVYFECIMDRWYGKMLWSSAFCGRGEICSSLVRKL